MERIFKVSTMTFAVLLCGAISSSSQSAPDEKALRKASTLVAEIAARATTPGCPVSFTARHGSGGGLMMAKNAPPRGTYQMLQVSMADPGKRRIVSAEVTVRGLSDKERLIRVQSDETRTHPPDEPNQDAARTMKVRFPDGLAEDASADLLVPGLAAASSVELKSLTYADGSIWNAEAGKACRTTVDGFMLVGLR